VRATARDGIVLLKNTNAVLPFKKPKSIAVIGSDSVIGPKGANGFPDRGGNDGTLATGWGSGAVEFPYLIAPLEAIKTQAQKDGTSITSSPNDNAQQGASAAQGADIAIVCINSDSGEGYITVEGNAGKSSWCMLPWKHTLNLSYRRQNQPRPVAQRQRTRQGSGRSQQEDRRRSPQRRPSHLGAMGKDFDVRTVYETHTDFVHRSIIRTSSQSYGPAFQDKNPAMASQISSTVPHHQAENFHTPSQKRSPTTAPQSRRATTRTGTSSSTIAASTSRTSSPDSSSASDSPTPTSPTPISVFKASHLPDRQRVRRVLGVLSIFSKRWLRLRRRLVTRVVLRVRRCRSYI
jgi:hypothetical protein